MNEELRREVSQRLQAEHLLEARVPVMSLSAEVALVLNESTVLPLMLQRCSELLVKHLDAAFARARARPSPQPSPPSGERVGVRES